MQLCYKPTGVLTKTVKDHLTDLFVLIAQVNLIIIIKLPLFSQNRLGEALNLFGAICNNAFFKKTILVRIYAT